MCFASKVCGFATSNFQLVIHSSENKYNGNSIEIGTITKIK